MPPALKYIDRPLARRTGKTRPGPRILFPVSGAQIALGQGGRGIPLEAEGGSRPYRWIVNDKPYLLGARQRRPRLIPDGPGFTEITLIDAAGRRARSSVRFIEAVAAQ